MKYLKSGLLVFVISVLTLLPISKSFAQSATLTLDNSEFIAGGTYNVNALLENTSDSGNLFGLLILLPSDWTINSPQDGIYAGPSECGWNTDDWLVETGELLPPANLGFQYIISPDPGDYQYIVWILPELATGIPPVGDAPCNQETFPFNITIPANEDPGDGNLPYSVLWVEGETEQSLEGVLNITLASAPVVPAELPKTGYDKPDYSAPWLFGIVFAAILPVPLFLLFRKRFKF